MGRKKKEETAMVKKETPVDLTMYEEYEGAGFESFGEQEFQSSPVLKISQPTSEFEQKGVFFSDNISLGKEIDCVVLFIQKQMRYTHNVPYGEMPPCWSNDAEYPVSAIDQPYHHQCNKKTPRGLKIVCPEAQFEKDEAGNPKRPRCNEQWVVALSLLDQNNNYSDDNTYLMYYKSTHMPVIRTFVKQLKKHFKGKIPTFGVKINLSLDYQAAEKGKGRGAYYVPNFPNPSDKTRCELIQNKKLLSELFQGYKFFKEFFSRQEDASFDPEEIEQQEQAQLPEPPKDDVPPPSDQDFQQQETSQQYEGWGK